MHARVSTFQASPDGLDAALEQARAEVLPAARALDGFRGMLVLLDRETGRSMAVTLWRDRDALVASEQAADRLRREAAQASGERIVAVERYEVGLLELEE